MKVMFISSPIILDAFKCIFIVCFTIMKKLRLALYWQTCRPSPEYQIWTILFRDLVCSAFRTSQSSGQSDESPSHLSWWSSSVVSFSSRRKYNPELSVRQGIRSFSPLFLIDLVLILNHLIDMQFNCMMGVFPEISRAWLTIDNDIFMWNYEDGCVHFSSGGAG